MKALLLALICSFSLAHAATTSAAADQKSSAAASHHLDIFQVIAQADVPGLRQALAQGADVNAPALDGQSPLYKALQLVVKNKKQTWDIVDTLIRARADIHQHYPGQPPLVSAAAHNPNLLAMLISYGCAKPILQRPTRKCVNLAGNRYEMKLDAQVWPIQRTIRRFPNELNWLISEYAGVLFALDGHTALEKQRTINLHKFVDELDEKGLVAALKDGANPNIEQKVSGSRRPCTAIQLAISKSLPHLVGILRNAGASFGSYVYDHVAYQEQPDPIHHRSQRGSCNIEILKMLAAASCPLTANCLHRAAENGHTDALVALRQAGADVNVVSGEGDTALHRAAQNQHVEALEYLLKAGARPNTPDCFHDPLHRVCGNDWRLTHRLVSSWCAAGRNLDSLGCLPSAVVHTAQILVQHGACVNTLTRDLLRHIFLIIMQYEWDDRYGREITHLLFSNGANLEVRFPHLGDTPLLYAARVHNHVIMKALICLGADTQARALAVGEEQGGLNIVEVYNSDKGLRKEYQAELELECKRILAEGAQEFRNNLMKQAPEQIACIRGAFSNVHGMTKDLAVIINGYAGLLPLKACPCGKCHSA